MLRATVLNLFLVLTIGCSTAPKSNQTSITHAGGKSGLGHMLKVSANVADKNVLLILDTGIGVNLISKSFCSQLKCKIQGSVTGKRMTGQSVTVPMSKVDSLQVANLKQLDVAVGVLDFNNFLPKTKEFAGVHGYLSLNFFENQPFTIDYKNKTLIFETPESLNERLKDSDVVPLIKKYEDGALTVQIKVKTPIQKVLTMQLDLGTNITIINNKYLNGFKPLLDEGSIKRESFIDETNFKQSRFYLKLDGVINLHSTRLTSQKNPTLMFQNIIYDGMLGNDFFKDKVVTYDLESSRLIISP